MARYGMDYGWEYDRWGQTGRSEGMGGYGGGDWPRGGDYGYGGMRSEGWGGMDRNDFGDERGWYGEGYQGFPGGGYDRGFRGGRRGGYEGWGTPMGGGYGGGGAYGGGGYGTGSYGGPGYGGAGYGGRFAMRDTGYETDYGIGGRGGWSRGQQRVRAAEIMTENPEVVTPDTPLTEVARKMRELDVGIIPVVDSQENRRLRGVITDRDIAVRAIAEGRDGNAKVADFMTEGVETCNKNDSVDQVLEVMRSEQVRRVPITDREGRLVGIIAQADLAVDFAGHDHEREHRVEETIERISEPGRPERGGRMAAGGRGAQNRGGTQSRQTGRTASTGGMTAGGRQTGARQTGTDTGGQKNT